MVDVKIERKIRRLSLNQLKILSIISNGASGVASSSSAGEKLKLKGKSLGGVFSSLSRQQVGGKSLIIPLGRESEGRSLRWRLNDELILVNDLKILIKEILKFW